jgi:hypothetical protein
MLQFFSASTSIVNSRRAITECLENALQGETDLNCDLIIIYTAMGHNFNDLLSEARRLSPNARIVGCTGGGIIGKDGPNESMKALAIMAIKGPRNEFAISYRGRNAEGDPFKACFEMALELKRQNQNINMIQFHPSGGGDDFFPIEKALEGIKSVFGTGIPIFGGLSMSSLANLSSENVAYSAQFFDEQVLERGAVMIGYADPSLKFISHANHGFSVIEGMPFEVTKAESYTIYELNGRPAWKVITETLGVPLTMSWLQVIPIAGFARELPEQLREEYGNKNILFTVMGNNADNSIAVPVSCTVGTKIWLTKRDEKQMFEGVDWMVSKITDELKGRQPVAVFHADCVLRGRFSLDRILKDEIINHMLSPISRGENIPWLGLYSAGEFVMLGGEAWFQQISSSLFVIYRYKD